jgi:sulfite exporter TauE/SafE
VLGEALVLGLSTGTYCALYCAPVLLPFLFSDAGEGGQKNSVSIALFMLGRLFGYLAIGCALGLGGALTAQAIPAGVQRKLIAAVYFFTGLLMILGWFLHYFPEARPCRAIRRPFGQKPSAFAFGLLTGLNFCPPFFAAASRVFGKGDALSGTLYFLFFYLGTSVFFLPLFGIPLIKKRLEAIRTVARITLLLIGSYFALFLGLFGWLA